MNRIIIQAITLSFMIFNIFLSRSYAQDLNGKTWKVGLATANITPEKPMWLAGYASRTKPSEGSIHPLWAKCILFEDAQGNRSLLLTLEVVGIGSSFSNEVRQAISKETGAPIENIIINCSHTHSGPVLDHVLTGIYPLDDSNKMVIVEYGKWLRAALIQLSKQALQDLEPVKLFAKNGVSRVQVNRRSNQEKDIARLKELKGPNDFSVPVFKVETASGKLKAIIFGYACHPTVLSGYQWSGDYAGFAQAELEKLYPGAKAFFFQGAGGDQNPLPRRTLTLAKQYGKSLAASVERVIEEDMTELAPKFKSSSANIDLPLTSPPTLGELEKIQKEAGSGYIYEWSSNLIDQYKSGKPILKSYPNYPIQVWDFAGQKLISLGGEVTIGYAVKLKEKYGEDIFVMAYSNDVMGYIPTEQVLEEGGYEGDTSQRAYGLPSKWAPGIEGRILTAIDSLMKKIR